VGTDPFLETPDTNTFELLNYWINVLGVEFRHTKKRGGWNSSRSFIFGEAFDIPLDANLKEHWTIDTIIVSSLEPFSISQVHILPVVAYIGSPCSHESRFLVSSRPQPACELYQGRLNHPPLVEEEHSLERHLRR